MFDSSKEAKRYGELAMLERAGIIFDLKLQPSFIVQIAGKPFCKYTADFIYKNADRVVIEEIKSSGSAKDVAYRLRRKAAELYYGIKVTEVIR